MSMSSGLTPGEKSNRRWVIISIVVAIIIAVTPVAIRGFRDSEAGKDNGGQGTTTNPPSSTESSLTAKSAKPAGGGSPSGPTPQGNRPAPNQGGRPPGLQLGYLSEMKPKGGYGNWQSTGAATMGDPYAHSLLIKTTTFTQGDPVKMTYTVPSWATEFIATIGLDDDSDPGSSVTFSTAPGNIDRTLASDDTPQTIPIKLHGERTLALTVVGVKFGTAKYPSVAHAVWGNARFIR